MKTLGKEQIEEKKYLSLPDAEKYFSIKHQYHSNDNFRPLNIVIIIMESFSKESLQVISETKMGLENILIFKK